jgi:hypothetical protein
MAKRVFRGGNPPRFTPTPINYSSTAFLRFGEGLNYRSKALDGHGFTFSQILYIPATH